MPLKFSYGKLTFEEVKAFLWETNEEFFSPLSVSVDIDSYAKKLSLYSDFSLCYSGEQLVGMISCYTNRSPEGYISNVCVKNSFQGRGIFSRLFLQLIDELRKKGIKRVRLEVDDNNTKAKIVYYHSGFRFVERNGDNKCLLEYHL